MSYYGYVLEAIGLLMIAFAFVIAYGIYSNAVSSLTIIGSTQQSSNQSINATLSGLTNSMTGEATLATYTLIEIAVLFLFVNIGYKLAYLGLQANRSQNAQKA